MNLRKLSNQELMNIVATNLELANSNNRSNYVFDNEIEQRQIKLEKARALEEEKLNLLNDEFKSLQNEFNNLPETSKKISEKVEGSTFSQLIEKQIQIDESNINIRLFSEVSNYMNHNNNSYWSTFDVEVSDEIFGGNTKYCILRNYERNNNEIRYVETLFPIDIFTGIFSFTKNKGVKKITNANKKSCSFILNTDEFVVRHEQQIQVFSITDDELTNSITSQFFVKM
jgi:hypothetical protein